MRTLVSTAFFLLACTLAHGQQAQDFGDIVVHYNTMPTEMLAADVARTYGITRSASRALINITVMRKGEDGLGAPIAAEVHVTATNLNGQLSSVRMRELREQAAIYYVGELRVSDEETFDFEATVTPEGGPARTVRFRQQFFTD